MSFEEVFAEVPQQSWLRRWMLCWPTAESPKSFISLAGLMAIGATLGRRVWMDHDFHTIYPMLNVLCIGPSGVGKTTALEHMGMPLVRRVPQESRPQLIEGKVTPQKLMMDLALKPHAILYAEELATLFTKEKFMESMIPLVTKLLNYLDVIEERTKGGDAVVVVNPSVTVAGGSTAEWLQDQLPDSATSGGFLARFLICHEQHKAQRVALPRHSMSKQKWRELLLYREEVFEEFLRLVGWEGEMDYADYEASDTYVEWYNNLRPTAGHLAPFAARGGEFVTRLGMLMALSCGRMTLQAQDVRAGIAFWSYCNDKLNEVVVPLSGRGKLLSTILKVVGNQEVTEQFLCRQMRNYEGSMEVRRLIEGLVYSGELVRVGSKIKRSGAAMPRKERAG